MLHEILVGNDVHIQTTNTNDLSFVIVHGQWADVMRIADY